MVLLIAWCILLTLCWPLALLLLICMPLIRLICLPLGLAGMTFDALFAFARALLFFPGRILGTL